MSWLVALLMAGAPVPLWITFDVVNPAVVGGHRILHLEDVLGPDQRRDIPGLPVATAALLFSVRPTDCNGARVCAEVSRWTRRARAAGGLVVAVVVTERDRGEAVRAQLAKVDLPIAISVDAHGVLTALGGLTPPGTFVVLDAKGRSRRWTPGAGRASLTTGVRNQVRRAFTSAAALRGG